MKKSWNPRFIAYAKAHGNTPEGQLEADRVQFPGGCMCGFLLWMNQQWGEFCKLHGVSNPDHAYLKLGAECGRIFDAWLESHVIA